MDEHRAARMADAVERDARLNRRTVLRAAAGLAGAATAAAGARSAAAQHGTPAEALPVHVPSGVDGVGDAYTSLPEPFQSVAETPGSGGTVRVYTILYQAPPPPRDENLFWQELETRLGVTWEPTFGPAASWGEKSAALLAGGDLGDLFYINTTHGGGAGAGAQGTLQAIQQGAFTDLTPYLTGDALQEYPNLARLPSYLWQNVAIEGKIYGVPKRAQRASNIAFYRADWANTLGLTEPGNADDVFNLLTGFTTGDPDGNGAADTYGLSQGDWAVEHTLSFMFRVPNGWRLNDDGTLTNAFETEEYRQTIEFARRMFEAGAYHPDTAAMTGQQQKEAFWAGQTGMRWEGYTNFWGANGFEARIRRTTENQEATLDPLIPPGHDGGQAVTYNGAGFAGFTAIPANVGQDEERLRELLRVMDYLAAPFGSEEWLFLEYGIEGVHHTVQPDGTRVTNDLFEQERPLSLIYPLQGGSEFYFPGAPADAIEAMRVLKDVIALGIESPAVGLYSETAIEQGSVLNQMSGDWVTAIVTGRDELSALDGYIQEWRQRGGDQMRQEYEQALQQQ